MSSLSRATCLVFVLLAPACARHVVVDPQTVASRNDPDWTIRRLPPPVVVGQPQATPP
jgi:hypothetical protein